MPGLFGILDLNPKSTSEEEGKIIFTKMADALRHHEEDRLEQASITASNLLVGRVGLPKQNPLEWPIRLDGKESGIHLFVSGPLLEREPNVPINKMPENSALCHWRGFFSAVLTEPGHGTTLLIVDRRASFPIYYAQIKDRLLFAPEVKVLLASLLVNREIDSEAFATFLAQGYLLGDQTLFRSVRRLQGGELLRIESGRLVKEKYWRYSPGSVPDGASQADLEHELGQLLKTATQKHMGEPDKTIIFLSGGVDSRGILGGVLASVQGNGTKLNTVTWGASQGNKDSDVAVAALIARYLNTNHKFIQRKITDYRENFTRVNYLMDGLSDISAFHPHEYQIMVELRNWGFERVLRGDEVFGWSLSASSTEGAFALAKLRRLRDMQGLASVIRETHYGELCDASDAAVEKALFEARDLSPNQAKDFFYFTHRLQCYLQTASYYKQIELDQRNVLLDDAILDFLAKVPDPMRIDKMLYRKMVLHEYPHLAQFPFAKRNNLEDWLILLAAETPVRDYALEELNDRSSGIWEFLDSVALTKIIEALGKKGRHKSVLAQWINPKSLVKQSLKMLAPGLLAKAKARKRARPVIYLSADKIVMRALVLKNWYDTFIH